VVDEDVQVVWAWVWAAMVVIVSKCQRASFPPQVEYDLEHDSGIFVLFFVMSAFD
jgi:hypothetical protein